MPDHRLPAPSPSDFRDCHPSPSAEGSPAVASAESLTTTFTLSNERRDAGDLVRKILNSRTDPCDAPPPSCRYLTVCPALPSEL